MKEDRAMQPSCPGKKFLMNKYLTLFILLILLTATGCSSVKSGFLKDGYIKNPMKMIKNIVIVTEPVSKNSGMAELVSNIASDIIKSQKNYIVHGFRKMDSKWIDECKNIEGVIVFSLKEIKTFNESVFLNITGKLFQCKSGDLYWSSNGADMDDRQSGSRTQVRWASPPTSSNASTRTALRFLALTSKLSPMVASSTLPTRSM